MQKLVSFILLLAGITLSVSAQQAMNDQELSEFLKQVLSNQRRMNAQLGEYTAMFSQTLRTYDKQGKVTKEITKSGESYQSWQRNLEITLAKDGKNLSDKNVAKEREKAIKALTKDAEERVRLATQRANIEGPEYGTDFNGVRISSFDIIRYNKAVSTRRDEWQGRDMIVVEFQPLPNVSLPDKNLASLAHLNSTLWIDSADKVIVRIQCRPINGGRSNDPAYLEEFVRMPDGMWLNRYLRFNLAVKPEIFNGQNREWIYERSNHQKFTAQVEDVKIDDPKPPQ